MDLKIKRFGRTTLHRRDVVENKQTHGTTLCLTHTQTRPAMYKTSYTLLKQWLGASKAKFIPDVRVEGIRVLIRADKNGIRSTARLEREDEDGAVSWRETETERSVTYPTHEPRVPPVPEHRSLTSRLDARLCVRPVSVCV
ncbi:unnamed protein product [Danaus chrysippus]|uniref:(African queen) hypothetical protein n=1 Tax=Danaus chrysippus TaxID=151541 RepID=A0A8J2W6Z8_9NEOP|nr:unnamed protein product [Danaus chrysippus]